MPSLVLICKAVAANLADLRGGHAENFRLAEHFQRLRAATEMTMRPWVSPNSSASRRILAVVNG